MKLAWEIKKEYSNQIKYVWKIPYVPADVETRNRDMRLVLASPEDLYAKKIGFFTVSWSF